MTNFFKTRSTIIVIIGLMMLSIIPLYIAFTYPHIYLGDDSLITLTFVKNIIKGNGWIYNHPPAVLATTTPLFTIIISGLSYLFSFVKITQIAVMFSVFCLLGIVWTFFFARKILAIHNYLVFLIGLLIIFSLNIGIIGMELYFFTFLLLLTIIFYHNDYNLVSGILSGLLFLVRGEGVLIVIILFSIKSVSWIVLSFNNKTNNSKIYLKKITKLSIGFFIPFIVWAVYSWLLFGNIFPNTLRAKLVQNYSGIWKSFTFRLFNEWLPGWSNQLDLFEIRGLSLWYPLILVGLFTILKKNKKWFVFLLWLIVYICGYSVLGVAGYIWYGFHIYFVLMLCYGFGIFSIAEYIYKIKNQFFVYALLFVLLLFSIYPVIKSNWNHMVSPKITARSKTYYSMSQWLNNNVEPSKTIAYFEIGYLGFYTNNKIFDLVGLTNPEVLKYIANRNFSQGFWNANPDYLIYAKGSYFQPYVKYSKKFKLNYFPIKTFRSNKSQYIIYKRFNNL